MLGVHIEIHWQHPTSQTGCFLFYYMKFPAFTYIIAYFSYNSNSFLKVCLSIILNSIFSLLFLCIYDIFHVFVIFLCILLLLLSYLNVIFFLEVPSSWCVASKKYTFSSIRKRGDNMKNNDSFNKEVISLFKRIASLFILIALIFLLKF